MFIKNTSKLIESISERERLSLYIDDDTGLCLSSSFKIILYILSVLVSSFVLFFIFLAISSALFLFTPVLMHVLIILYSLNSSFVPSPFITIIYFITIISCTNFLRLHFKQIFSDGESEKILYDPKL